MQDPYTFHGRTFQICGCVRHGALSLRGTPTHARACGRAMGKNSNVHKGLATLAVDLAREKEADAKRERKRAHAAAKLAERQGLMAVEEADGMAAASSAGSAAVAAASQPERKTKAFGKVKVGIHKKLKVKSKGIPLRAGLEPRKRHGAIRKPSAVMRKTLKKMAKKREMEMG